MVFAVLAGQPAQLLRNRAQVRTVRSLTELEEGRLFRLDYKADYRLQDFVDADLDSKEAVQGGSWISPPCRRDPCQRAGRRCSWGRMNCLSAPPVQHSRL